MPAKSTVVKWALDDLNGFSNKYAHAREIQLGVREDEIVDIADDGTNDFTARALKNGESKIGLDREHVERSKLRVETRKWLLTKLRPDRFGDKVETKHTADGAFLAMWQHVSNGGRPGGTDGRGT